MWISVSRFQFKNISNVSCRQIYVQRLWRRNDFTKSPEVPYFDCLNSRSLTVNRGFNRGIIILVGGRKANRKPENMNKFSFGHVHLPRIFNQVRYLKTYMFMTKKELCCFFTGWSKKKKSWNLTSFVKINSLNFIGFRSYFCM